MSLNVPWCDITKAYYTNASDSSQGCGVLHQCPLFVNLLHYFNYWNDLWDVSFLSDRCPHSIAAWTPDKYLVAAHFRAISKFNKHLVASSGIVWVAGMIAKFMGPTWGPSGAERTQVDPILAPWTLLSETLCDKLTWSLWNLIRAMRVQLRYLSNFRVIN